MLPRMGDRRGRRVLVSLPAGSAAQAWESFALISLSLLPGFVTALSDPKVGGPFPARLLNFNPARPSTARLAGEMPPLREGDRYFWGCACERSKTAFLPFFLILNLVPEIWFPEPIVS